MQTDSMTMEEETIDGGAVPLRSTANASDDEQPGVKHSLKQMFSLYDDDDEVDMQTVKPTAVPVKSLTPPHSPLYPR